MLCLSRKRIVVTKDRPHGPRRSVTMFIVVECEDHSAIQAPLINFIVNLNLKRPGMAQPSNSLVEGEECLYQSNCQKNMVMILHELSLLFWPFTWPDVCLCLPLAVALPGPTILGKFNVYYVPKYNLRNRSSLSVEVESV